VKYGAGRPVHVRYGAEGDRAVLVVKDEGIGIDPADQLQIFERFERAVSSRNYGGLGLGLFIVKRIVEAHEGTISVESRPGEGAAFRVELPVRPSVASRAEGGEQVAH
jgi:signal transduction histidine kinase